MSQEYLKELDEEQLQAVTSIKGAIRLIAGPGSGKTYTLTRRVAYICDVENIEPERILSLTFTNKAAGEMRERVSKFLNVSEDNLNMMTFHSLACDIVKLVNKSIFGNDTFKIGNSGAEIIVPKFFKKHPELVSGLDEDTVKNLRDYVLKKVSSTLRKIDYVQYMLKDANLPMLASTQDVLSFMEKEKASDKNYTDTKRKIKETNDETKIQKLLENYAENEMSYNEKMSAPVYTWVAHIIKQKSGCYTFDDLIKCTLYVLKNFPKVKNYWSNKFDYIQVDEFQDTDDLQLEIVKLLYERHGNLFVVGDPDQSIYLFRNAKPQIFLNLGDYIPNLRTIFINTNYRSSEEIIRSYNESIKLNKNRIQKDCKINKKDESVKVKVLCGTSDSNSNIGRLSQLEFVEIKKLLEEGVNPNNIAILYRSIRDDTIGFLQDRLDIENIPYVTTYKKNAIYEEFIFSLGCYTLTGDDYFIEKAVSLFATTFNNGLKYIDNSDLVGININNDDFVEKCLTFLDHINREFTKRDNRPTASYKKFLDSKSDLKVLFKDLKDKWFKLDEDSKKRLCSTMSLEEEDLNNLDKDGIKIMTMHKAKGLEFEYVFVNSLSSDCMDRKHVKSGVILDSYEEHEEKVRLAYVAFSRAKKQLYLCLSDKKDIHAVVGTVLKNVNDKDIEYVGGVKDEIIRPSEESIESFNRVLHDRQSSKMGVSTYYPLVLKENLEKLDDPKFVEEKDIIGYRYEYTTNTGECIAYQANIKDLKRLDCIPVKKDFLIGIGIPIKVIKEQDGHFFTNDELQKSKRVYDCKTDEEIELIFRGGNNGYKKDVKLESFIEKLKIPDRTEGIDNINKELEEISKKGKIEETKVKSARKRLQKIEKEEGNEKVEKESKQIKIEEKEEDKVEKKKKSKKEVVNKEEKKKPKKEVVNKEEKEELNKEEVKVEEKKKSKKEEVKVEPKVEDKKEEESKGLTFIDLTWKNLSNRNNPKEVVRILSFKDNKVEIQSTLTDKIVVVDIKKLLNSIMKSSVVVVNLPLLKGKF